VNSSRRERQSRAAGRGARGSASTNEWSRVAVREPTITRRARDARDTKDRNRSSVPCGTRGGGSKSILAPMWHLRRRIEIDPRSHVAPETEDRNRSSLPCGTWDGGSTASRGDHSGIGVSSEDRPQISCAIPPRRSMLRSISSDHGNPQLTRKQLRNRCFAEKIGPGAMLIPASSARA
jgi:hypothetical protein